MDQPNPLAVGFYTVPEAARLIRVGSTRRIYGWLRGYPNRQIGPLLSRDFEPFGDVEELSFLDLMEVRFVEHFRDFGVRVRSLRIAAESLREEFKTNHPFALSKVILLADKADVYVREILRESAEKAGDVRLRSLTTKNYVMYEAIKQALIPGIEFDPQTDLARTWKPLPKKFPGITIDPWRSYGQPTTESGIPTSALFDAWNAEGQNPDTVADWYNIGSQEVIQAVGFEQALNEAAQNATA